MSETLAGGTDFSNIVQKKGMTYDEILCQSHTGIIRAGSRSSGAQCRHFPGGALPSLWVSPPTKKSAYGQHLEVILRHQGAHFGRFRGRAR